MQLKGKLTEVKPIEGLNRYGEPFSGYNCTLVETGVAEGQYRNAITFYIPKGDNPPQVGDHGTLEVRTDIRDVNGRKYNTANGLNWKCEVEAPL